MPKPNFLIIGAQKCGTTSLHFYLSQHKDIYCSEPKELHYFDSKKSNIEKYKKKFSNNHKINGESTPIYIFHPNAPEKIKKELGQIKIIIVLRNPVLRAYSHYWHEIKRGWENRDFKTAINEDIRLLGKPVNEKHIRHYSYFSRGLYTNQIEKIRLLFNHENIKIIRFSELMSDPLKTTNETINFIDPTLETLNSIDNEPKNPAKIPRSMRINRLSGYSEELLGEDNYIAKIIRKANLVQKNYPKISNELYSWLKDKYETHDPESLIYE